jgi:hypothetical protein
MSMLGSHLSSGGRGKRTTRTAIVLALFHIYCTVISIMFDTSSELLNCSFLTSANAEYIKSSSSPAVLKQALV